MPRKKRIHIPGFLWHITHRCHKKEHLLKFEKDRKTWRDWLFKAKKRYGLKVITYAVTCNHIHLLAVDSGKDVISKSMQLLSGNTGKAYNIRKNRKGAFWEDRFYTTAIENGVHLLRCMAYIELNMVRAGAVKHPMEKILNLIFGICSLLGLVATIVGIFGTLNQIHEISTQGQVYENLINLYSMLMGSIICLIIIILIQSFLFNRNISKLQKDLGSLPLENENLINIKGRFLFMIEPRIMHLN